MFILGHRGFVGEKITQNSLPAFEEALASADGFETDACVSKDGEIFLIHPDDNGSIVEHLDAASADRIGARRFDELSATEIGALHLRHGKPIPTLQQALELAGRHRGKILNIELKGLNTASPVMNILQKIFFAKTIDPQSILISSFDHAMLMPVREAMPALAIGALIETLNADTFLSPLLHAVRPDVFVMPEKLLNDTTVKTVGAAFPSAGLVGWTVTENNDYDEADLLARLKRLPPDKITAMIVDNPRAFVKAWANG